VLLGAEDPAAKETVAGLVRDLGGHPIDAGPLTAARYVEPAMMLLVSLAYAGAPRGLALRRLER
jgi:8-hydroxy-5-deazaflavin:NADPH oxidoreductase